MRNFKRNKLGYEDVDTVSRTQTDPVLLLLFFICGINEDFLRQKLDFLPSDDIITRSHYTEFKLIYYDQETSYANE